MATDIDDKSSKKCLIAAKLIVDEEKLRDENAKDMYSINFKAATLPNVKYYIHLDPNEEKEGKKHVGIFLHVKSCDKCVHAEYTFSIDSASDSQKIHHVFDSTQGQGWGYLVLREHFLNPEKKFIVDGKLIITLKGILQTRGSKRRASPEPSRILKKLFKRDDGKDFVIAVGDNKSGFQEIKVHKWILEDASSVFSAMVESGLKETKENRVEITDFSFEDVKIIVQHIYEQEVKSLINDANAKSLLRLADKYNLNGIQIIIEDFLISKLDESNVCEYANLSVTTNSSKLREHCVCFILDRSKDKIFDDGHKLCSRIKEEIGERIVFSSSNYCFS